MVLLRLELKLLLRSYREPSYKQFLHSALATKSSYRFVMACRNQWVHVLLLLVVSGD